MGNSGSKAGNIPVSEMHVGKILKTELKLSSGQIVLLNKSIQLKEPGLLKF